MSILNALHWGAGRRLPMVLQTEATECGLACLAMVAGFHRHQTDMMTLRRQFPISLKGATLKDVMQIAHQLDMGTRPLKLDLDNMGQLKLPCVLHWNFNHFVVLKRVGTRGVHIHDPACGARSLSWDAVSQAFTGVALEVWPAAGFKPARQTQPVRLRQLTGKISGLMTSLAQMLALALVLELFALVSPFFLQWVVDHVLVAADRDLLTTLALGFGLLMLMQQAVGALRSWGILYLGTTLNIQWRANVFTHLVRLPVQYFEKRHLGDIVSRFGAIDHIQHTLTTAFLEAVLDGLMTIITLGMIFVYSPLLGAVALSTIVLYALLRWLWYSPLRNATDEQIIHAAKQQTHFLETVRGIKTIQLFQRQDYRRGSWLSLLIAQINADLRIQKLQLAYKLVNGVLFSAENILIIWLGARLVLDGNFSAGALLAVLAYKGQFDARASALVDKFYDVKMLQLQGARLADIVLAEPDAAYTHTAHEAGTAPVRICVKHLSFRYAEQEAMVLEDINFTIEAGESVAVVGPSGCGKTTLMSILLGLLTPTSGQVTINGVDLRHCGAGYVRTLVGTVLQDDVLFTGSIADNIHFFDPHADHAWVEKCAGMAAIADEIGTMPMGYQTLVGDMGTVLSGGQKQRILLARALYKRPRILLLDEATSHLDVDNEKLVNESIKSLNITRIIIAHRPETIASTDRVISIENGKIM
ncbi:ATP-binding cassette subfamily B protein RaxB [Duganella sp. 1224]|uniref:peptidase domain-containing ABC transporter n=1 Tax=Duganella sp. 1224 TaxID=2587052 RepID=UPI0015CD8554|nr:peptidase domain-containing ABC transporter [Duganella sp. 1224]NYE61495.1 ATP-binding cassette subfamily B protein RaxB [Duganella sp. 1224]